MIYLKLMVSKLLRSIHCLQKNPSRWIINMESVMNVCLESQMTWIAPDFKYNLGKPEENHLIKSFVKELS